MRTILVPLDGSPLAEEALPPACRLARQSGASLVLLRAAPQASHANGMVSPLRVTARDAAAYLQPLQRRLVQQGFEVRTRICQTGPVRAILFAAQLYGADVIAMSTHGSSGLRRPLGSVAEEVLHRAAVPVLLTRPAGPPQDQGVQPFRRILVPLDGTQGAEAALAYLVQEDLVGTASVVLLQAVSPAHSPVLSGVQGYSAEYVWMAIEQRRLAAHLYLDDVVRRHLRGMPHRIVVVVDHAASAILDVTAEQGIDLVVMGTHGRMGLDSLRGSVGMHVLRHACVPTLLVQSTAAAGLTVDHPARPAAQKVGA